MAPAAATADNAAPAIAKRDVADSFSRAAVHYDSVAGLQRDVGAQLLTRLDDYAGAPQVVLDLGSGTGFFAPELAARFPAAQYIGLDIAEGMARHACAQCTGQAQWLVADAEALPLAAESVDLVYSSLAIQWCERPRHLFAELARVLRPGGCCVFTSLGPATLRELREAWAAVDAHQHVNSFLPGTALRAAADLPGLELALDTRDFYMHYDRVRELLDELKTLGAHNMNRQRAHGLTGRRALQGMLQAYEAKRENGLLPATYEVQFGILRKA
ncbi:MAG: malonyl-ACP O-methyltransferase BioC [Halioglobus sp.]|nr:malonyl-ACP O-methyltransferase BioC [Halioglobus sp.]